MLFLRCFCEFC